MTIFQVEYKRYRRKGMCKADAKHFAFVYVEDVIQVLPF